MRSRRYPYLFSVMAFFAAMGALFDSAQDPQVLYVQSDNAGLNLKIDVNLVTVDAVVRNDHGDPVRDLRPEDFAILDNGIGQELTHFSRDQLPLAVAIVIDRSPSIAPYLRQLRGAARSALNQLRPDDQVALFSFDLCSTRLSDLTIDRSLVERSIGQIRIGTDTNIYGAVFDAAHYLKSSAPDRRRAIILISDNSPNVFHIGEQKVLQELLEVGATLYSIRTRGEDPVPGRLLTRPMYRGKGNAEPESIERIATQTGGEVLNLNSTREFPQALTSAILNLRLRYTLGFIPSKLGEKGLYHTLTVNVPADRRCAGCVVHARAGYYVTQESIPPQQDTGRDETYDCEEMVAYDYLRSPYALVPETQDLPFKFTVANASDSTKPGEVRVEFRIDARRVRFLSSSGLHSASLLAAVFCLDEKGKKLGEYWKRLDLEFKEEPYKRLTQSGISFSSIVRIEAPSQRLRVFVYDLVSRRFGMREKTTN